MLEDDISLEDRTTDAYEKLVDNMPPIGFISRKKRIKAFIQITEMAQYMINTEEITEEIVLYIFSVMMRKCAAFQKASTMTALSLDSIAKNTFSPIGLEFILEVRRNLNLPTTHHNDAETEVIEEKTD
ncbi:hypothetical protein [Methyloprofundus sp.]|uniref:hypothetical protein n=1 Tax=Methyloprofundus sp. TaxID=2020875 RepID=UPI003D0E1937